MTMHKMMAGNERFWMPECPELMEFVQGPRQDEHDVVDHVVICAVLEEGRQGGLRVAPQVVELVQKLVDTPLHERRRVEVGGLVLQKLAVASPGQLELQVVQGLALA